MAEYIFLVDLFSVLAGFMFWKTIYSLQPANENGSNLHFIFGRFLKCSSAQSLSLSNR